MKNLRIILSLFAVQFISLLGYSQIPNPGFENWSTVGFPSYDTPDNWGNLNGSTFLGGIGVLTCEKGTGADAHSGNNAIKLTSKTVLGLGDAPGIAVTGTINTGTQELEGGFSYTQRPTHFAGWYKYSPQPGDNCEINVTLWKTSPQYEEIGTALLETFNSIPNFTRFMIPIIYTSANTPDSGRILLVSTNTDNIQIGSQLIVDDLEFVDCSGFSLSVATMDASTIGGADGSAMANVSGGTLPYVYEWGTGGAISSISNLTAGIYCVTVTDNAGCTVSDCGTVSEPGCTGLSLTVGSSDVTTVSGNDGAATANPVGGTAPYTYLWSTADTGQTASGLVAGNYCVTVTDFANCQEFGCVDVNEPDCSGFNVSVAALDESLVGANDGSAMAAASGGATPYSYLWSNDSTMQDISGLSPGLYCVTATDNNGCTVTACDSVEAGAVGITDLDKIKANVYFSGASSIIVAFEEDKGDFILYDLAGKAILNVDVNRGVNHIDASSLSDGVYFYQLLLNREQLTNTGKIILQL